MGEHTIIGIVHSLEYDKKYMERLAEYLLTNFRNDKRIGFEGAPYAKKKILAALRDIEENGGELQASDYITAFNIALYSFANTNNIEFIPLETDGLNKNITKAIADKNSRLFAELSLRKTKYMAKKIFSEKLELSLVGAFHQIQMDEHNLIENAIYILLVPEWIKEGLQEFREACKVGEQAEKEFLESVI